jgi:hypothetical protein
MERDYSPDRQKHTEARQQKGNGEKEKRRKGEKEKRGGSAVSSAPLLLFAFSQRSTF